MKKVIAILTSDWHLREDQPICRTDNFWYTQWKKVQFVSDIQRKYNIPVIHAGDLFNHWKPSPLLLSKTIKCIPDQFYTIYGNHDLPQHNVELSYKSGVYTLIQAGKIQLLKGIHWNAPFEYDPLFESLVNVSILVWHKMTWSGIKPFPGSTDPSAQALLRKYPQYQVILTGHNHKAFATGYEGRILVNPGSITRHDADQVDHKPRVYLLYDNISVDPVYLPIEQDVISREHIERKEQRDDRLEAFVSRLNDEWEAGISYEDNLERFFTTNEIKAPVKEIIYKATET